MQQNSLAKIFVVGLLASLSIFLTIQIFTAGGNILGSSFRYLTPMAAIVGLLAPRFAFYLLLLSGAYLDLIKRFMILDSGFTEMDLAFLLGFAPALVAGIVLKFLFEFVTKSTSISSREIKLFFATTFLCSFLGAAQVMMGEGLRSAGGALNMVAYLYVPLILPRIFRDISELKNLMIAVLVIYLPAVLWAINQAFNGLAGFEMQYLLSGMTTEVRQLDEEVFRNMGTMVSAHALSMVASILAAALIIPVSWKNGKLNPRLWVNPLRWVIVILFVTGAYYTFSRTGWACAIIAILAFICLQSRILTFTAFFTSILAVIALYASADYLLQSRIMVDTQDLLFEKFGTTAEARQSLTLGTLDARLESMASFATDSEIWTPFGMKIAGTDVQLKWVHDILTETLIKVGYIPLALLVIIFLVSTFVSFKALFRMPKGPHRMMASYFAALAIGMMSGGFSQGAMILFFPINFFWCLFLGAAYSLYLWHRKESTASIKVSSPGTVASYSDSMEIGDFGGRTPTR